MKRTIVIVGTVGLFACGVVTLALPPTATTNSCADDLACGKEFPASDSGVPVCVNGACTSSGPRPILVVSVPLGAAIIGGNTFALASDDLPSKLGTPGRSCSAALAQCDFLPTIIGTSYQPLKVSLGTGVALWPPGLRPNEVTALPGGDNNTTLPVHAVFHPLWPDAAGRFMRATKLGLPLMDVAALLDNAPTHFQNGNGPTLADSGAPIGIAFAANLPQAFADTEPAGRYQLAVTPDDPYDVFPPFLAPFVDGNGRVATSQWVDVNGVPGFDLSTIVPVYTTGVVAPRPYIVDELSGSPSLEGWQMYVVDADGNRVSGIVRLPAGATKSVNIYDATTLGSQAGETLYIDPPSGVDLPRYVAPAVATQLIGPFDYPALPSAVTVSGFVRRSDTQQPATASIVFFADGDANAVAQLDGSPAIALRYTKHVNTTSAAQYATTIPPGVMRAYVVPDDNDLAITVVDQQLISTDAVQSGRTLFVNPRTHVKGRVVLADGTPVFGADVVIDASPDLVLTPKDDPLRHAREARGMTDVNGSFDVMSDSGMVDISIRPRDGTNLPWVVLTNHNVPLSDVSDGGAATVDKLVSNVVIPLPIAYTQHTYPKSNIAQAFPRILTDSVGNVISSAVLRAYVFPAPNLGADGGVTTTRAARLVGMTTTDEVGAFQLFVAPLDP